MVSYSYLASLPALSIALEPVKRKTWLHVQHAQAPPHDDFKAINKKYRFYFHPLSELPLALQSVMPFEDKIIQVITCYVGKELIDSIYAISSDILNPEVSLQYNLEKILLKENQEGELAYETKAASGTDTIVTCISFTKSAQTHRKFAIKQPEIINPIKESYLQYRVNSSLKMYINNLLIAEILHNHPNFMKVFGVAAKKNVNPQKALAKRTTRAAMPLLSYSCPPRFFENLQKNEQNFIPYLILEYVEGEELQYLINRQKLSEIDIHLIFTQFLDAMAFLFTKGVLSSDVHLSNLLFTKDKQLKFIDFDFWTTSQDPLVLARELYTCAQIFTQNLARAFKVFSLSSFPQLEIPPLSLDKDEIFSIFKDSLQNLSTWFDAQPNRLQGEDVLATSLSVRYDF